MSDNDVSTIHTRSRLIQGHISTWEGQGQMWCLSYKLNLASTWVILWVGLTSIQQAKN